MSENGKDQARMKTATKLKLLAEDAGRETAGFSFPEGAGLDEKLFATKLHAEKMQGLSERIKELADCVRDDETRTVYLGIALQAQKEAQIWQEVIGQMKICQKAAGISKRQMEMARLAEMLRKIKEA